MTSGLPLGEPVEAFGWQAPDARKLYGASVTVEPIDVARHADHLWQSIDNEAGRAEALWAYLGYGPFPGPLSLRTWLDGCAASVDPRFYALVPRATGAAAGMASLMRVDTANGVIEIGHIWLAPGLQRTRAATEGLYLLMSFALDTLGYRRLEWKCNALNAPSRRAADRFGFTFEGVFRQHMIVKGRNRDTAWYAIVDRDWPPLRDRFRAWLAPANFDASGRQKRRLEEAG